MEDGNSRSFMFESAPGYAIGDKVKVVDGRLIKGWSMTPVAWVAA